MDSLKIVPLPALKDNYIWLLHNEHFAAVIDPGEAEPVLNYLKQKKLQLTAILITHRHNDHVGGIIGLLDQFTVPVYGPSADPVPRLTVPLVEGEQVDLRELGIQFSVLDIPGHTAGHIAYYGANALFCGDTLFGCGCGRVEGTPQQMFASLAKLAALPDDTAVYCGHEYTVANIDFALAAEPDNTALRDRRHIEHEKRTRSLPTLPSTIGLEKQTNPFLRYREPALIRQASLQAGAALANDVAVFAALRAWKNRF